MKILNEDLFNEISKQAITSPRLRMNYNLHKSLADPVNRLINAIEPDSYIRPHRHLNPDKDESFLVLRGRAVLFLFDGNGAVTEQLLIDPLQGVYGAEIKPGVWHTLLVLQKGTIVYEVKEGPFQPLHPDNFAPWSPHPDDTEQVKEYMEKLTSKI